MTAQTIKTGKDYRANNVTPEKGAVTVTPEKTINQIDKYRVIRLP